MQQCEPVYLIGSMHHSIMRAGAQHANSRLHLGEDTDQMNEWMNERMDGCTHGWMDGWVDGWMGGCMKGWMDAWMRKRTNRCTRRAQLKHLLESAVGVFPASTASVVVFSRRQLIRGSCTKASSMAITLSLLLRSTRTTFSQVNLHRDERNCHVSESHQQKRLSCF